jgi:decaprenylphospho-beta-D-ribofuranose 2-oxidase
VDAPPPATVPAVLCGWGRTAPSRADVAAPRTAAEVAAVLAAAGVRGVVPRGLGRAYGDAAQNAGGLAVDMTAMDAISDVDSESGAVTVGAGVSFDRLIRELLPHGWFVPVTPGTRNVTLGGAIACDIHGKNHHVDGSLSRHVEWIELVTPRGEVRRAGASDDAFAATAGGMGLTGVVTAARLRLRRVASSAMRVTTERAADLDDLLRRMTEEDHLYRYSVAWIDCLARGRALGRGVLTRGDHAEPGELPRKRRAAPLALASGMALSAPPYAPRGLLSRPAMRVFNAAWYRKAPRHDVSIDSLTSFFHPLDGIRDWNRLYGPDGMLQYQAVVPFGQERALEQVLELLSGHGAASFLAVLKRFGPGAPLLSFPRPGWTLAVDFAAGAHGLGPLLDQVDEVVAGAGGRVYLAKDSRMRPDLLAGMYPELSEWRRIRDELDPDGVMTSDLARRLGLTGPAA